MVVDFIVNWIAFTPVFATPLLLASLGLIINERAGVLNLGAEGIMLCGAFASVMVFIESGNSLVLGVFGAIAAGILISALFAFMVVILRLNQVVSGIAIVFFGSGLTGLIGNPWTEKAVTGFSNLDMGLLSDIPVIGKIIFSQDLIVYLTIPIILAVWWFLHRSVPGMNLRAVGENPQAADAAGLSVDRYRFLAVLAGGALMGLAGGYLALAASKIWVEDMTHGRGWIAIALVIFARWMPGRALLGALLFGGIEALIPRVQAVGLPVPQYYLLMLPYLATLAVLIYVGIVSKRDSGAPGALGLPYTREDRR
jgi:simple sugar transport system permease protein